MSQISPIIQDSSITPENHKNQIFDHINHNQVFNFFTFCHKFSNFSRFVNAPNQIFLQKTAYISKISNIFQENSPRNKLSTKNSLRFTKYTKKKSTKEPQIHQKNILLIIKNTKNSRLPNNHVQIFPENKNKKSRLSKFPKNCNTKPIGKVESLKFPNGVHVNNIIFILFFCLIHKYQEGQ